MGEASFKGAVSLPANRRGRFYGRRLLPRKWGRQVLRAPFPSPQMEEAGFKDAVSFPAKWEQNNPCLLWSNLYRKCLAEPCCAPACGGKVVPTGTKGGRRKAAFILARRRLARRRLPPCREAAPLPPLTWSPSPIDGGGKFLENVIAPSPINGEGKFLGKVCQSLSSRRYLVCHFLHSQGEGVMGVLVYEEPAVIGG